MLSSSVHHAYLDGGYLSMKSIHRAVALVAILAAPVTTGVIGISAVAAQTTQTVPSGTILQVTPLEEITSKKVEVGEKYKFQVVADVVEQGTVVIPRGSLVIGEIKWKTGRAIGGKSGKFEVEFQSVSVNGTEIGLTGTHRQEGRGNTVGALLGSIFISGRSAVMIPGQIVNALVK
jgi:hypothetical protein